MSITQFISIPIEYQITILIKVQLAYFNIIDIYNYIYDIYS